MQHLNINIQNLYTNITSLLCNLKNALHGFKTLKQVKLQMFRNAGLKERLSGLGSTHILL